MSSKPVPAHGELHPGRQVLLLDMKCRQVIAEGEVVENWKGKDEQHKVCDRTVMCTKVTTTEVQRHAPF